VPAVVETAVRTVRSDGWKKYAACSKGVRIGVATGLTDGDRQLGALHCE
jgi:hypothetical protein